MGSVVEFICSMGQLLIIVGLGARLPYQYCSKNFSGYRCHPRSVVGLFSRSCTSCSTDTV